LGFCTVLKNTSLYVSRSGRNNLRLDLVFATGYGEINWQSKYKLLVP